MELSNFDSEFTATKQLYKYLQDLKYKLRIIGILFKSLAIIYEDNNLV